MVQNEENNINYGGNIIIMANEKIMEKLIAELEIDAIRAKNDALNMDDDLLIMYYHGRQHALEGAIGSIRAQIEGRI